MSLKSHCCRYLCILKGKWWQLWIILWLYEHYLMRTHCCTTWCTFIYFLRLVTFVQHSIILTNEFLQPTQPYFPYPNIPYYCYQPQTYVVHSVWLYSYTKFKYINIKWYPVDFGLHNKCLSLSLSHFPKGMHTCGGCITYHGRQNVLSLSSTSTRTKYTIIFFCTEFLLNLYACKLNLKNCLILLFICNVTIFYIVLYKQIHSINFVC